MSENINFIPANELPVAEGDEVSVLCVENGELKQKAASGLGGGESADMVLKLVVPFHFDFPPTSDSTTITIESGSLENVVTALESGKSPIVKVHRFFDNTEFRGLNYPCREGGVYDCSVLHYDTAINFMFTVPGSTPASVRIAMFPDDPGYMEMWVYPLMYTTIQVI